MVLEQNLNRISKSSLLFTSYCRSGAGTSLSWSHKLYASRTKVCLTGKAHCASDSKQIPTCPDSAVLPIKTKTLICSHLLLTCNIHRAPDSFPKDFGIPYSFCGFQQLSKMYQQYQQSISSQSPLGWFLCVEPHKCLESTWLDSWPDVLLFKLGLSELVD